MNSDDSTIPYILVTITNSLLGHQLPTKAKKTILPININIEVSITD